MAYDRLLERLYTVNKQWIVKGAVALLARDIGVRASKDIDVYREGERAPIEAELRDAATLDIGDWFRFEVGPRQVVSDGGAGIRLPVDAYVGGTVWASFHVDLVGSDLRMTGQPEDMPALARVAIPEVSQSGYKVYPLVDHVADKMVATFDGYGQDKRNPSTRFRDLVDLVAISLAARVDAASQINALESEASRRDVSLPERFDVPDRILWESGYAAEARRSLLPIARGLDEALDVVRPFTDSLLDGSARGSWDPEARTWNA
ncbi:MAG: nucleotidyl transferase AbiEii/AbiGii toxin family protein [Solirubrobacteraceae bacterium]